ncbi:HEM14 [[Candida] subhashii]|uniref:Protoporphyrinogen oxidase n=1 Tax=[Candida] subhashii TaxID=561895 RepID=A0A8J5UHN6_9ASCO|nr:HEM14 [[Candida] subhashii]KAG7663108.1 HEM14 [[Candida] subhashii]
MSLAKLPPNAKVAVLGAGISGLSFTYFLHKLRPDVQFHIFEKSPRSGGWINSSHLHVKSTNEQIILEKGPRTLRGVKDGTVIMIDILRNLNKEREIEIMTNDSIANRKYVMNAQQQLIQIPNSFMSLVKFLKGMKLMNGRLLIGILREPFVPVLQEDESIEGFFTRRFGSSLWIDNLGSAVIHGIYASDVAKLSVMSTLPVLKEIERESGSIVRHMLKSLFGQVKKKKNEERAKVVSDELTQYERLISPDGNMNGLLTKLKGIPMIKLHNGLEELPRAMTNYLANEKNIKIHYNSPIKEIDPISGKVNGESFDHIRSTINTHALSNALPSNNPLRANLSSIEYVNIFLCNIYSKKKIIPSAGFGFLVPKFGNISLNPQAHLGTIYDSDIEKNVISLFGERNQQGQQEGYDKITIMLGGHYYSNWEIPSKSINLQIIYEILKSKLRIDLQKFNIKIIDETMTIDTIDENDLIISYNYHNSCIPVYGVGYLDTKAKVIQTIEDNRYKLSFGGTVFADGVAVPDCVSNAFKDSMKLM